MSAACASAVARACSSAQRTRTPRSARMALSPSQAARTSAEGADARACLSSVWAKDGSASTGTDAG
eukprot:796044-Rhodomonas_salina.1